jgi:SAM-dependent methyltransferase
MNRTCHAELGNWNDALTNACLELAFKGTPTSRHGIGAMTYGELSSISLQFLLAKVAEIQTRSPTALDNDIDSEGGLFVDLGSGFGRVVLGVACQQRPPRFGRALGIEIDSVLYAASMLARQRLEADPVGAALAVGRAMFAQADARSCLGLWAPADVLYVCCTCFDDILCAEIASLIDAAEGLRHGAIVVTVSRRLPASTLEPISCFPVDCSWGHADIFIDRKR